MSTREALPCQADPDQWFAWPGSPRALKAKQLCMDCPLYWSCQEYALEEGIPYGVWGGLDEKQREHIWKRWPNGKPVKFLNSIDEAIRPLLQDRRDRENDDKRDEVVA